MMPMAAIVPIDLLRRTVVMADLVIGVVVIMSIDPDLMASGVVLDLMAVGGLGVISVIAGSRMGHFLLCGLVVLLIEHLGFSNFPPWTWVGVMTPVSLSDVRLAGIVGVEWRAIDRFLFPEEDEL